MANFCTNCGTKLEKDASFCTNCGTKVVNSNSKETQSLFPTLQDKEIKMAKKELKRLCGGFSLNDRFRTELTKYGIRTHYYIGENGSRDFVGSDIKKQLKTEINSGQIKTGSVEFRLNELMLEHKTKIEKGKRIIDELFESEDTQSKIKENKIDESQINSIKHILQHTKVNAIEEKDIETEIRLNLNTQLEKKSLENKLTYVENRIKKSHPNIKLTSFEKNHINNRKLYGDSNQIKNELNTIADNIIKEHMKVGEYDFAGMLIEEAGLTNRVDPIGLNKRVRKESNYTSYVFLKIYDDNMKILGSKIKTINLNTRLGMDMTIFFRDIISVNYATDWRNNGEIKFDLNNRKFKVITTNKEDEKYLEEFYKLLEDKWKGFKNKGNVNNSSTNNEVSSADELMKYAELYEKGILSEDEFNAIKKKLLQL